MFRAGERSKKWLCLIVFFATFLIFLNGLAVASGESGPKTTAESSHEAVEGGGHGEKDRSADLRDLLYRFINFALLIIILFFVIKKSGLKDSLKGRIEEIKQRLEDLSREKEEAENKYQDIEKKLRDFEEEKKEIIEQFQKEGEAEKEKIIAEANERAKQIVEQAQLTIQQEMQSAKDRLKQEVLDLAAQKAQEIIEKEITEEDQDRLVDEFIERVGKIH